MSRITLPHNGWIERPYQEALWDHLCGGGKRAIAVWHRRSGKDEIALHYAAVAAHMRVGNYVHCLPEYAQGRKAIWTAVNPHTGKRRIDESFPLELRDSTNDHEMFIRFKNGSTWSVIGSDTYNTSIVGTSIAGIVFSEYALANPSAWAYCRPVIEENKGWALFITTPRGRNHAKALYDYAVQDPGWFAELLTVHDTGALTDEQCTETMREYVALYGADVGRAQFEQEYLVSFNAATLGAFYSLEMAQVRSEGRILPIEPPPGALVHRSWDLGIGHSTSVWFFCVVGPQVYILDHYAARGVGLEHYCDVIEKLYAERGWQHGTDFVPHDIRVKEWIVGRTRVESMRMMGLSPMLAPAASVDDGINAVRRTLPLCVFHPRCETSDISGIGALELYRRSWDDELKTFKKSAVEDWTTDPADSFRYLSLSWRQAPLREVKVPQCRAVTFHLLPSHVVG